MKLILQTGRSPHVSAPRSMLRSFQKCLSLTPWPPAVVQGGDQCSSFLKMPPLSLTSWPTSSPDAGGTWVPSAVRSGAVRAGACPLRPHPSLRLLRGRKSGALGRLRPWTRTRFLTPRGSESTVCEDGRRVLTWSRLVVGLRGGPRVPPYSPCHPGTGRRGSCETTGTGAPRTCFSVGSPPGALTASQAGTRAWQRVQASAVAVVRTTGIF